MAKSINELLVSDVVGHERPVHVVQSGATVEEVVHFLSSKHVSGAPIVDGKGLLVGIIDFQDILHHIVAFGLRDDGTFETANMQKSWEKFRALYLSDVSSRNPLIRLTPDSKLSDALELLFSGVHRVLIVAPDEKRRVINVLTQSDLLRFLNAHSELIPLAKQLKSVEQLGLGSLASRGVQLHSVLPETKAKDAFLKMRILGQRALPIVDAKGVLISQISASDMRLIFDASPIQLEYLELSCLDFAKKIREKSHREKDLLIFVEADDNLSSVLSKMVKKNVHRVFITDNLISLRGVVSITDLATALL